MRFVVLLTAIWLAGCTAPNGPVGESLGGISYVRDKSPLSRPATWVWAVSELPSLKAMIGDLGDQNLTDRLQGVDPSKQVVITVYYDGCTKAEPGLLRDGSALTVRYGKLLNRTCVRAEDTLALFAVARADLSDPAALEVCGRTITVSGNRVEGSPIGIC